jgi:hypothetical protein
VAPPEPTVIRVVESLRQAAEVNEITITDSWRSVREQVGRMIDSCEKRGKLDGYKIAPRLNPICSDRSLSRPAKISALEKEIECAIDEAGPNRTWMAHVQTQSLTAVDLRIPTESAEKRRLIAAVAAARKHGSVKACFSPISVPIKGCGTLANETAIHIAVSRGP